MKKTYDMPGWPPTEEEMVQIHRRAREERAAVARSIFMAAFGWIVRKPTTEAVVPQHGLKAPAYY